MTDVGGETYEVVEDLITNDARHLEALLAGDRVDNHVAMDTNKVLGVKNAVLILEKAFMSAVFVPLRKQESSILQGNAGSARDRCTAQPELKWGCRSRGSGDARKPHVPGQQYR